MRPLVATLVTTALIVSAACALDTETDGDDTLATAARAGVMVCDARLLTATDPRLARGECYQSSGAAAVANASLEIKPTGRDSYTVAVGSDGFAGLTINYSNFDVRVSAPGFVTSPWISNVGNTYYGTFQAVVVLTPEGFTASPESVPEPACNTNRSFGWAMCTKECPCADGEGDCDKASDCGPNSYCARNVGANYGYPAHADVCQPR